jgi:hypothetical protein
LKRGDILWGIVTPKELKSKRWTTLRQYVEAWREVVKEAYLWLKIVSLIADGCTSCKLVINIIHSYNLGLANQKEGYL